MEKKFEIIFVSSDRDEKSFQEYFESMPWLALPFSNREAKNNLSRLFSVEGIPTFVVIDPTTGKIISDDGRSEILSDPDGKKFPWHPTPPAPLESLSQKDIPQLNRAPTLLLLLEQVSNEDEIVKAVTPAATELFNKFEQDKTSKPKDDDDDEELSHPLKFFYLTKEHDPLPERIRAVAGLSSSTVLTILNLPEKTKYVHDGEVNSATFKQFVDSYLGGHLKGVPLK